MKPIKARQFVNTGIVIYSPPLSDQYLTTMCTIKYNKNNPLFSWITCEDSVETLWTDIIPYSNTGSLFIYESLSPLKGGFYTITLNFDSSNSNISGDLTIGVLEGTPYIIIGLPHSSYAPINLS